MDTAVEGQKTKSAVPQIDLYRIGGIAGIVAGVVAIVSNALHPRLGPGDLGDQEKFLKMVSDFGLWRLVHLAIIVALIIALVAFVAIARSIIDLPAASWSRVAIAAAIASGGIATVSFAVDGFVLAEVAEDWAAGDSGGRGAVLDRMATIEYFDTALFSATIITLFGATQLFYGIALWTSETYSRLIGGIALAGGAAGLVSGISIAISGEIGTGNFLILFSISSVLLAVWLLAASVALLQRSRGPNSLSELQHAE
jgi:hypothetical protein